MVAQRLSWQRKYLLDFSSLIWLLELKYPAYGRPSNCSRARLCRRAAGRILADEPDQRAPAAWFHCTKISTSSSHSLGTWSAGRLPGIFDSTPPKWREWADKTIQWPKTLRNAVRCSLCSRERRRRYRSERPSASSRTVDRCWWLTKRSKRSDTIGSIAEQ